MARTVAWIATASREKFRGENKEEFVDISPLVLRRAVGIHSLALCTRSNGGKEEEKRSKSVSLCAILRTFSPRHSGIASSATRTASNGSLGAGDESHSSARRQSATIGETTMVRQRWDPSAIVDEIAGQLSSPLQVNGAFQKRIERSRSSTTSLGEQHLSRRLEFARRSTLQRARPSSPSTHSVMRHRRLVDHSTPLPTPRSLPLDNRARNRSTGFGKSDRFQVSTQGSVVPARHDRQRILPRRNWEEAQRSRSVSSFQNPFVLTRLS